jgi:hypothetical protein
MREATRGSVRVFGVEAAAGRTLWRSSDTRSSEPATSEAM